MHNIMALTGGNYKRIARIASVWLVAAFVCGLAEPAAVLSQDFEQYWSISGEHATRASTAADLNGDGELDLLLAISGEKGTAESSLVLYYGVAGGFEFERSFALVNIEIPDEISLHDMDADGDLDVVVTARLWGESVSRNEIFMDAGDVNYVYAASVSTDRRVVYSQRIADINQDNLPDILQLQDLGQLNVFVNQGNLQFLVSSHELELPINPHVSIGVADFNRDDFLDICLAGSEAQQLLVWGSPELSFDQSVVVVTDDSEEAKARLHTSTVADFNKDGLADFVKYSCQYSLTTYLQTGDGSFPRANIESQDAYYRCAGGAGRRLDAADFDGDGDLDVMTRFGNNGLTIFRNDGTGDFTDSVQIIDEYNYWVDSHRILDPAAEFLVTVDIEGARRLIVYRNNDAVTSVTEQLSFESLSLYPNPASDKLTISGINPAAKTLEVLDVLGRRVMLVQLSSQMRVDLDVRALNTGAYFVQVRGAAASDSSMQLGRFEVVD